MEIGSLVGVLAVFALVALNGFFVAAEFALVKVRTTRVEQLVLEGNRTARVVQQQTSHLDSYIAATQLGITLASLALGWIGEPALAHLIEAPISAFAPVGTVQEISDTLAIAISFILITGFHIVLGELVPKSIALQRSERVALFVAQPLLLFARAFRPFIAGMNGVGNWVVRRLGLDPTGEEGGVHSVEELELLVAQSREAGVLDTEEEALLRNVFDFGDKRALQAMTPRSEIVALEVSTPLDEALRTAIESGYSRFPIYHETLDQVVGVVHVKDLLRGRDRVHADGTVRGGHSEGARARRRRERREQVAAFGAGRTMTVAARGTNRPTPPVAPASGTNGILGTDGQSAAALTGERAESEALARLARPATFVLEGHHLSDALGTFQREGAHMALVVDEYGQIVGLLTMEDVLEELVGEIQDEYDTGEDAPIAQLADGTWRVAGGEAYDHVREVVGLPAVPVRERGSYNTLPGLIMLRLGRLPVVGDRVDIGNDWEAEVAALEGHRVTSVLLRKLVPEGAQEAATAAE